MIVFYLNLNHPVPRTIFAVKPKPRCTTRELFAKHTQGDFAFISGINGKSLQRLDDVPEIRPADINFCASAKRAVPNTHL